MHTAYQLTAKANRAEAPAIHIVHQSPAFHEDAELSELVRRLPPEARVAPANIAASLPPSEGRNHRTTGEEFSADAASVAQQTVRLFFRPTTMAIFGKCGPTSSSRTISMPPLSVFNPNCIPTFDGVPPDYDVLSEESRVEAERKTQCEIRVRNDMFKLLHLTRQAGDAVVLWDCTFQPEIKEDFSGCLVISREGDDTEYRIASSYEIASTWNLHDCPLLVSREVGAYGVRSLHETGVPVHRSFLLTGAHRVLLPTGRKSPSSDPVAQRSASVMIAAALKAAINSSRGAVGRAVNDARRAMIGNDVPVEHWAVLTLQGLP
jgi:hypothetical protein